MIAALVGLVLPSVTVWFLIRRAGLVAPGESTSLTLALAIAGGIGLSSVTTFLLVSGGVRLGSAFAVGDGLLWVALGVLLWWVTRRRDASATPVQGAGAHRLSGRDWTARVAFAITAALAVSTVCAYYLAAPHGEWDAWAIWNQRARFLIRAGDDWTVVRTIPWSNPSHPLLVSASVARLWAYAGAELTFVPAALSGVYGALVVAAMVGALHARHAYAWVAGAVVMSPVVFTQLSAAQTADLPTGLYMLLTIVLLRGVSDGPPDRVAGRLCAAGLAASLAAWTKNEGVAFLVVTSVVLLVVVARGGLSRYRWWIAGLAPVCLMLAWFKLYVAPLPPAYMSEAVTLDAVLARVRHPDEHLAVLSVVARKLLEWGGASMPGGLLAALGVAGFAAVRGLGHARLPVVVVLAMLGTYYTVWLASPIDSAYLATMTFDRLVCQVWPTLVLAAFSMADSTGARMHAWGNGRVGA